MADPAVRRLCRRLQALEDAIAYRRTRLAHPCPDCRDGIRCDEHACDLILITGYEADVRATSESIHATGPHRASGTRRARARSG